MCMTWVIHMCNTCNVYDMSHSHVTHLWHESCTRDSSVTWVMHMWLICVRHESCRTHQVTDMNATYMNVDTDINVDICDMMCTTWVIHMCNMARVSVAMTRHRYEWDSNYDTTQIWMRLALCSRLSSSSLIHICVVCRVTSCNSKGHGLIFDITGSCHVYECLISHIRINHSAHMHETRRTYMNESCDTYEWVMSLGAARDSRGYGLTFHTYLHTYNYIYTRRNESSHTYEWVVSPGAARDSRGHGHIFEWQHWVHLGIYLRARPVMRHELYIRLRNELA